MKRFYKPTSLSNLFYQSQRFGKAWRLTSCHQTIEKLLFDELKTILSGLTPEDISVNHVNHDQIYLQISSSLWAHHIRLHTPKLIQVLKQKAVDYLDLNTKAIEGINVRVRDSFLNHQVRRDPAQEAPTTRYDRKKQRGFTETVGNLVQSSAEQMPYSELKQALLKLAQRPDRKDSYQP